MPNFIRIAHSSPIVKPFAKGSIYDPPAFDENIETITFDEQRIDEFMERIYRQVSYWDSVGYKPTRLLIDLGDYRNLLVYKSMSSIETFMNLEVVVQYNYWLIDGQKDYAPKVLPSNEDLLRHDFFRQKEKGQQDHESKFK